MTATITQTTIAEAVAHALATTTQGPDETPWAELEALTSLPTAVWMAESDLNLARRELHLVQWVADYDATPAETRRWCMVELPKRRARVSRAEVVLRVVQDVTTFTVRWTDAQGTRERDGRTADGIERIGALLNRQADRRRAWDIQVLNGLGDDVTFNFACFQV